MPGSHQYDTCGCGQRKQKASQQCQACARAAKAAEGTSQTPAVTDSVEVSGNTLVVTKRITEEIKTLEDLIRVCKIDTTEWEVERWVCNKWDMAAMPKTVGSSKKWQRTSTEPIVTQIFQVKAWFKRPDAAVTRLSELKEGLLSDIRAEARKRPPSIIKRPSIDRGWLFEFAPFDLHLGKYTWAEETVTNFDTHLAADLFDASLDFLLQRAMNLTGSHLDRVLCVFGNDVAHADSKKGETTAGTHMDYDTRYIRVYRRICAIHRRAVNILREIAPVDVVVVPGNHDELTSFHLGEVLAATYENDPRVTIDNAAKLRKYYNYGSNLFGFTHGDAEKVSELPLLMAREVPDLWAKCSSREWHIGHKHISERHSWRGEQDLFSDKGVRVRRLSSLSAHDAWHVKHAFVDRRACDAFIFHKEAGFTSNLSFNVDHFSGKPVSK